MHQRYVTLHVACTQTSMSHGNHDNITQSMCQWLNKQLVRSVQETEKKNKGSERTQKVELNRWQSQSMLSLSTGSSQWCDMIGSCPKNKEKNKKIKNPIPIEDCSQPIKPIEPSAICTDILKIWKQCKLQACVQQAFDSHVCWYQLCANTIVQKCKQIRKVHNLPKK